MIKLKLSTAADWMNARLYGADQIFTGVCTDSRLIQPGNLFVAIKGEKVDSHDFLAEVQSKGAVAAIVEHIQTNINLPQLQVENTILALGTLAKQYRQGFSLPLAAVTGSCGKTTVKEMLASILSVGGPSLASQGNLNTEVGLPLTLLRLDSNQRCGVIEMGARKKGDIRYLMSLADPDVTLITNAGVAHIEIFGSEKGIAEAKGEIFSCLKANGTAVINADDVNADYWKNLLSSQKVLLFGLHDKTNGTTAALDFTCSNVQQEGEITRFELKTPVGIRIIKLNALGQHSISNALAAAATAHALGINLDEIHRGLEKFHPVTGRLQFKRGKAGIRIMDDTYNANPVSVKAALAVLANGKDQKIFVMGDMLELGNNALQLHREMGEEARRLGIEKMYGFGTMTAEAIKAFGNNGKHFSDKTILIQTLESDLLKTKTEANILSKDESLVGNKTILVKGSRGMRMEEVVQALLNPEGVESKVC